MSTSGKRRFLSAPAAWRAFKVAAAVWLVAVAAVPASGLLSWVLGILGRVNPAALLWRASPWYVGMMTLGCALVVAASLFRKFEEFRGSVDPKTLRASETVASSALRWIGLMLACGAAVGFVARG